MTGTKPRVPQEEEERNKNNDVPPEGGDDEFDADDPDGVFALADAGVEDWENQQAGNGGGDRTRPVEQPEVADKPVPLSELNEEELRYVELQNLLLAKGATGLINIPGKDSDYMKDLLERVRKEMDGAQNKGRPQFGEATRELFAAYKAYLETKGVRGVMEEMASMQIGTPSRSPEELTLVNMDGKLLPEQPIDFWNRMRSGDTKYKLQTFNNGRMEEVDTTRAPSRDALDRMLAAESFMKWAQDEIIFDRKVRLQEERLVKRINEEGWPKEWLDSKQRQTDRFGWCMSVMDRMEEARKVGRTVEAIFQLRTKDDLRDFGTDAIKKLPPHVSVELVMNDGSVKNLNDIKDDPRALRDVKSVKSVKCEHPLDLDLKNPDFVPKRRAETDWLRATAPETFKLLHKEELAKRDPRYMLFQGDIETKGMQVLIDKKTGEVVSAFRREDFDTAEKRKELIPPGRSADDFQIEDFNIIRCRMKVSEERDPKTNQLKNIVVDYGMQYGHTPLAHTAYAGLWVDPVGKPSRPKADEHADGLQRFGGEEWVVGRSDSGEDTYMKAKDLEFYTEMQDLKRGAHLVIAAAMDASMFIGGVGTVVKGVQAIKGAAAAYRALSGCQKAMALMKAGSTLEGAGLKMIMKGGSDIALATTGVWANEQAQKVRGGIFLAHAFIGLPGVHRSVEGAKGMLGMGKDAQLFQQALEAGKLKPGPVLSAFSGTSQFGFKWSNRAFAVMLTDELVHQQKFIAGIGKADGVKIAQDRMRGIRTPDQPPTPEQQWEQQDRFLKTVEKTLEDYQRNQDITHKEDVQKILDRTKKLLEPPPKELLAPGKEGDLKAFRDKRAQEVAQFKKELRDSYLLFDGQRISDAEKQRAEKTSVYSSTDFQRLKDDPVIVTSTQLEKKKYEDAQTALKNKEEEYKAAGEAKTREDKARREEEMFKLTLQRDFAKQKYEEEVFKAAQQLRKLETEDARLEGKDPERKFEGKQDVQKAAALAYLLLSVDERGNLPQDGVLHREDVNVPGWSVTKSWTEGSGDATTTVSETLKMDERKITQELRVDDLAAFLTGDLTKENPNGRRINTAEVLDRLGVIPPELHASTLKRIMLDSNATPEDKRRAIANMGAVISQIELEEARRAAGLPIDQRFIGSGERYTNTSADLKQVLEEVAKDPKQSKDVRAFASYQSFVLSRKQYFDDRDRDFLNGVLSKEPPGLTYAEYLDYMKPMAGLKHKDREAPQLGVNDKADWDRRLRAALALEQMIDPATGRPPDGGDFGYRDINKAIAGCFDPKRPEQTTAVLEALTQTVKHDGVPRMRISQIDKDDPVLGTQLRQQAVSLLNTPFNLYVKDENGHDALNYKEVQARAKLIEKLPELLKADGIDASQQQAVAQLRKEAARLMLISLYATEEGEIRNLRVAVAEAEAKKEDVTALKRRLADAEREYSEVTGKQINPDTREISELTARLVKATTAQEKQQIRQALEAAYQKKENAVLGAEIEVDGKKRPDLSNLNFAGFSDESIRKAAVKALGAMGWQDPEVVRVLRERATPPAGPADTNTRVEGSPEVRLASLNALSKFMAPLDFANLCNELVLKERSPGVAEKLRMHTWYSDIGLDPQSPQYQDMVARKGKWDAIVIQNANDLANAKYKNQGSPYYFLNATDLHSKIVAAIDSQYHWLSSWFYSNNSIKTDEANAINGETKKFQDAFQDRIITPASSTGKDQGSRDARKEAQNVCYALLAGDPPDGWQLNDDRKKEQLKAGYGNMYREYTHAQLQEMRFKSAKALAAACEPGMPDRDYAGKLVYEAINSKHLDYRTKIELLKGLTNLGKAKFGPDGKVDESDKIVFAPAFAADKIFEVLHASVSEQSRDRYHEAFQMECVRYLRRNVPPEMMLKLNTFADLEAVGKAPGCPPAVRHALWELIAQNRDRVIPAWNRAPRDEVTADPQSRAELLDQALRETQPAGIGGKESYSAPLVVDDSVREARAPSSVFKIAAACRGEKFGPDDPRVPKLRELMKKEKEGGGAKDERVRLAAAMALLKQTSDAGLHEEAIKVIAEVAVDGYRPGTRSDAQELLKGLSASNLAAAEKALKEFKPARESSNKLPFSAEDMAMKEASRLGLIGQVQVLMGKDNEAEVNLRAAFNIYRGKPQDAKLFEGKDNYMPYEEMRPFDKYKNDKRLKEVAGTVIALGEVVQRLKLPGEGLKSYGQNLQANLGRTHPDVIKTMVKQGDTFMRLADQPGRSHFSDVHEANQHYIRAYNGMLDGLYPAGIWDKVRAQEKIGNTSLLLSEYTKRDSYWGTAERDVANARRMYEEVLKRKEDYKFPPGELAEGHWNLARAYERSAKLEPAKEKEWREKAEAEVKTALQIARANQNADPDTLAAQIKNAAEFYRKRGDNARAEAIEKEAASNPNMAASFETKLVRHLQSFEKTGLMPADFDKDFHTWLELNKQRTSGGASEELAIKTAAIVNRLADKLSKDVLPEPIPYNAETFKKAEPSLKALVAVQKERIGILEELVRQNPGSGQYKEWLANQCNAMAGFNRGLLTHYLEQKDFARAEQVGLDAVAVVQRANPNSVASADALSQLIEAYAMQGKRKEIADAVDKHMARILEGGGSEEAMESLNTLLATVSQIEIGRKVPGLSADIAEQCTAKIDAHLKTLPLDRQAELLANCGPKLSNAVDTVKANLEDYLTTDEARALPEADRAKIKASLQKLSELQTRLNSNSERPMIARLRQWEAGLPKLAEDADQYSPEFKTLMENYVKSGNIEKAQALAGQHLAKVIEKGTPEQVAASFETAMSTLGQTPPDKVAAAAVALVNVLHAEAAKLPAAQHDAVMAKVGPRLKWSLDMFKLMWQSDMENATNQADRDRFSSATKLIEESQRKLADATIEPLKKAVESWSSKPHGDECESFPLLLDQYITSLKLNEAKAIATSFLSGVLKNGNPAQFASALHAIESAFTSSDIGAISEILRAASAQMQQQAAALPANQKDEYLASYGSNLMRRFDYQFQQLSRTPGSEEQAKQIGQEAANLAKLVQDPLKKRMADLEAKTDDESRESYRSLAEDLGFAYVRAGDTASAKALAASLTRSLTAAGRTRDAIAILSNIQERFCTNQTFMNEGAAVLDAGLEQLLEHAKKMPDGEEKSNLIQEIMRKYERLPGYVTAEEGRKYTAKSEEIKKLLPAGASSR